MRTAQQATYFRLRARGYELAARVAEALDSLDGEDAAFARECEPSITVSESPTSGSTYVYLDSVKSRISDHGEGEYLDAPTMVERWLAEVKAETPPSTRELAMSTGTKMGDKQLAEITRLMTLNGRKSFGALVRRVHGEYPDRQLTAIEAGKIISFLRQEAT